MGGYPNFCGIYMFDDFNKCADLPPLSRNQQKALKRKKKQINMSNDQNMSPQHSTKIHSTLYPTQYAQIGSGR